MSTTIDWGEMTEFHHAALRYARQPRFVIRYGASRWHLWWHNPSTGASSFCGRTTLSSSRRAQERPVIEKDVTLEEATKQDGMCQWCLNAVQSVLRAG